MPNAEGTVGCIQIGDGSALVTIRTGPNSAEAFILWFDPDRSPGPMALWVPELSIALARGLTVIITHGTTSAYIDMVTINAP